MENKSDYFKSVIKDYDKYLDKSLYTILWFDGNSFHNFTKNFLDYYDPFLHDCIIKGTQKLVDEYFGNLWSTIYHQSDEITIIIPPMKNKETELPFSGRVTKYLSVFSSKLSLYVSNYLLWINLTNPMKQENLLSLEIKEDIVNIVNILKKIYNGSRVDNIKYDRYGTGIINKGKISIDKYDYYPSGIRVSVKDSECVFDCKVFQLEDEEETRSFLTYRRVDALRNSKSSLGRLFFSHKEMIGKSSSDVISEINEKYNIDWYSFPQEMKRGTIIRNSNNIFEDGFVDH